MKSNFFCSLKQKKDFKRLSLKGKKLSNSLFLLIFLKNENIGFQYAISVNKKNFRTAVIRNKIKRQIRNVIKELDSYKNIDCLIVIKKEYLAKDYKTIKSKFKEVYQKIRNE